MNKPYLFNAAFTRLVLLCAFALIYASSSAQSPPNGTTIYRCIDLQGVVSFADAPCTQSVSHRLRIEHSMIQSVPISIEEQQRLRALEVRLNRERSTKEARAQAQQKLRIAEAGASTERCKQARLGLTQIRSRKRRGYPVSQSQRIDNEEQALHGQIASYCTR